jgi:hypothetical protein
MIENSLLRIMLGARRDDREHGINKAVTDGKTL